jgi:hypothetical protein
MRVPAPLSGWYALHVSVGCGVTIGRFVEGGVKKVVRLGIWKRKDGKESWSMGSRSTEDRKGPVQRSSNAATVGDGQYGAFETTGLECFFFRQLCHKTYKPRVGEELLVAFSLEFPTTADLWISNSPMGCIKRGPSYRPHR